MSSGLLIASLLFLNPGLGPGALFTEISRGVSRGRLRDLALGLDVLDFFFCAETWGPLGGRFECTGGRHLVSGRSFSAAL